MPPGGDALASNWNTPPPDLMARVEESVRAIIGPPRTLAPEALAVVHEERRLREEERIARLRETMADLPLWDAVFAFALSTARFLRPREMGPIRVTDFLTPVDAASLRDAESASIALVRAAYDYGDRLLAGDTSVRAEMAAKHPGFSESSLAAALDYGCFQAR